MSDTTDEIKKAYKPDDQLTRTQAARELGISERRLDQLRDAGELVALVNSRRRMVRFRFKDVAKLRDCRAAMEVEDEVEDR